MATLILKDAEIYLGGQDISGDLNQCQIDHGAEMQDDTVFGDDTRSNKAHSKAGTNHPRTDTRTGQTCPG